MRNGHENLFYQKVLSLFAQTGIPFLVGGAHTLYRYTGVWRDTKDLDLFVMPGDCKEVLRRFSEFGFKTELHFTHWIGKIFWEDRVIDVIFSSANGLCPVDREWFEYAREDEIMGVAVKLCPPEELIWQKAFIMERLRYDGADIAHIIQHCSQDIDWDRLLRRFGQHWRVLFTHLILFGFIFPGERAKIPERSMLQLTEKLIQEIGVKTNNENLCRGTYLSILEYLDDLKRGDYRDARITPYGHLNTDEVWRLTKAFVE